jgi:hypothetical protein
MLNIGVPASPPPGTRRAAQAKAFRETDGKHVPAGTKFRSITVCEKWT